jgi:hypothetical protein
MGPDVILLLVLFGLVAAFFAIIVALYVLLKPTPTSPTEQPPSERKPSRTQMDWYDETSDVVVFASMPDRGIVIEGDAQVTIRKETAVTLAKEVFDTKVDGFIGFASKGEVLQFMKQPQGDGVVADRPGVGGSHQTVLTNTRDLAEMVEAFFDHVDLSQRWHWSWIEW